jgi:predicted ATP-dependent protease
LINRLGQNRSSVVYEPLPNPVRLFGQLEYRSTGGSLSTNVSLIRPGALHKAHDGYLILEAHVLLTQGAWDGLKRALRTGVVELHNPNGDTPIQGLEVAGAPVHTQVFLIGPPEVFQMLENDTEFTELFRYRIEFSPFWPAKEETRQQIGGWLGSRGLSLSEGALSVLYDHARRLIGERERVDARLLELLAIAQEASKLTGSPVGAAGMDRVIQGREDRASLADDEFMEGVIEGTWAFDVKGQVVGQINSLVVLETDPPWGRPVRVTARVAPGREGVLSIDREAGLGGQIFHKAVLTLGGYMRGHYAGLGPLSAAISLVFEQNYANIEGDSAGLAELLAALSAIGNFPLRQDLGLTGAVDQTGKVLAIGGGAPKAEGFYRVCKALGLSGNQGVVVPKSNLQNLTLKDEVMQSIRDGQFHVYAVETVDEALELYSGKPASEVHALVEKRLLEFKELENGDEDKDDKH